MELRRKEEELVEVKRKIALLKKRVHSLKLEIEVLRKKGIPDKLKPKPQIGDVSQPHLHESRREKIFVAKESNHLQQEQQSQLEDKELSEEEEISEEISQESEKTNCSFYYNPKECVSDDLPTKPFSQWKSSYCNEEETIEFGSLNSSYSMQLQLPSPPLFNSLSCHSPSFLSSFPSPPLSPNPSPPPSPTPSPPSHSSSSLLFSSPLLGFGSSSPDPSSSSSSSSIVTPPSHSHEAPNWHPLDDFSLASPSCSSPSSLFTHPDPTKIHSSNGIPLAKKRVTKSPKAPPSSLPSIRTRLPHRSVSPPPSRISTPPKRTSSLPTTNPTDEKIKKSLTPPFLTMDVRNHSFEKPGDHLQKKDKRKRSFSTAIQRKISESQNLPLVDKVRDSRSQGEANLLSIKTKRVLNSCDDDFIFPTEESDDSDSEFGPPISLKLNKCWSFNSSEGVDMFQESKGGHKVESATEKTKPLSPESQWNAQFQRCLERLHGSNALPGIYLDAHTDLIHLSLDFIHVSRSVGKIIISEVFVPDEEKTIKPNSMGGRAGGDKYMIHNILFKFAVDSSNLFQGSNWAAAKVANHELKGLMSYFSLSVPGVYLPLMVLIDYRGFRLVAMSVLPISPTSIVYGSQDGGKTIQKSNGELNKIMMKTMKELNLKPHICGAFKGKTKKLWSAADIEGHVGLDGKFYLLDFSRTMPPVTPDQGFPNGHLYRLFRREFVVSYPTPLCSDAYSGFIMHDPNTAKHNSEIDEATIHLLSTIVPNFTASFYSVVENKSRDLRGIDVVVLMHGVGINLRYIGDVINCFRLFPDYSEDIVRSCCRLLLIEATSRIIKNEINKQLRGKMHELKLNLEVPYRRVTIQFLNIVFGDSQATRIWWQETLPPRLKTFFNLKWFPLRHKKQGLKAELFDYLEDGRELLFRKIVGLMGLKFTRKAFEKMKGPNQVVKLQLLDMVEMDARIKDMEIVSSVEGSLFFYKSLQEVEKGAIVELLEQSIEKYKVALRSMPTNKDTLFKCALACFRLLLVRTQTMDNHGQYFEVNDPYVQRTDEYFALAVSGNREEICPKALCVYALFLEKKRDYTSAEEYFLSCLERNPKYSFASIQYGNFLILRGHPPAVTDPFFKLRSTEAVVSPLTCKELGDVVNVFTDDSGSQSLRITASMTIARICKFLASGREGEQSFIYEVDLKTEVNNLPQEEISTLFKSHKSKLQLVPVPPSDCPYPRLQRPNNTCVLFFSTSPSFNSSSSFFPSSPLHLPASRLGKKGFRKFKRKSKASKGPEFNDSCSRCGNEGWDVRCTTCLNVFCLNCSSSSISKNPCIHGGAHLFP